MSKGSHGGAGWRRSITTTHVVEFLCLSGDINRASSSRKRQSTNVSESIAAVQRNHSIHAEECPGGNASFLAVDRA
jgi:hypothetical protein